MGRLDDSVRKRTRELLDSLSYTTRRLDKLIGEVLSATETSSRYWNSVQVEVRRLYEDMRRISATWADENIPIVYRDQIRRQIKKLKARRFETQVVVDYRSFVSSNSAKQSLAALLSEINSTWFSGFRMGENTLIRLSRLTQQFLVREKQIEKAISEGFMQGGPGKTVDRLVGRASLYGIQRRLYTDLRKKAAGGKYITIMDRNGNPEQWTLDAYTELVARTKMIEASTQAVINTTTAMGEDLIQVSAHNSLCDICCQYEGKIFSLSGTDPDFPKATELTPFHPQCQHSISTVIKEGLVVDGTLEAYSAFSRGETEIHPTRKGWIPVSERKTA